MTIILSACLIAEPASCKDFKLGIDGEMDSTHCAMYAPPFFAQWSEEHPGWVVKKWQCRATSEDDT